MTTTSPDNIPLIDPGDIIGGFRTQYNAQSNALQTALTNLYGRVNDDDSVEFIADLPVVDNWNGRLIFCEEDQMIRLWDGSAWIVVGGKTPYWAGTRAAAGLGTGGGDQNLITAEDVARSIAFSSGVLTIEVPGFYSCRSQVNWNTVNTTGQRNLGFATTGTIFGPSRSSMEPPTISTMSQDFNCLILAASGDTITPFVAHNSGAALNCDGSVSILWTAAP